MSTTVVGGVPIISMPDLGAFNDTSSVVGERAGSGRFSAASVQSYMGAGIMTQTPTGQFFTQDGAKINRFNDRMFVGPATMNDGAYPNVSQDWLQAFLASTIGGSEVGPMVSATMSVLAIAGAFAFVAGTRTSDNPGTNQANTIGISSFAINDNTARQSNAWAFYGEARRLAGITTNLTYCCEFNVSNQDAFIEPDPYNQYPGETTVMQIAAGCGLTLPGAQDASRAISIQGNPTKYGAGIVFAANAIRGTDGTTGTGTAIMFAKGHSMVWYDSAGQQTSSINCSVSNPANATAVVFSDAGFTVQAGTGDPSLIVPPVANVANWASVTGAAAGGRVSVAAGGTDANIDLALHAKGTGSLDLWGTTAATATTGAAGVLPTAPVGYLIVKLSGTAIKIPFYAP